MTARIPVSPKTLEFFRQFVDGAGGTYEEVLLRIIRNNYQVEPGDDAIQVVMAGASLREDKTVFDSTEAD